ncbi:MAG: prepilin-type N-terminal cleavage/methylation domain-containing protein [Methylococcales bacterium]|jgi:prepilin-type N-terminal cleavage/methylation domain-containing protein|nr:prepilin-type N-terminal cleavage/methylation domain-containing protein [Methylococcales bacterium]
MIILKKHQGFTMVELLITLFLGGMVTAAMVPNYADEWNERRANIAAAEVWSIVEASQKFIVDNTTWPDQANNCAGAFATLGAAYLGGMDATSPWGTTYTTSCNNANPVSFSVSIATSGEYAGFLVNSLPATTASGATTTTTVPTPSGLPGLQALLPLDGSRAMTGALDMGNNNINNVVNLSAINVTASNNVTSPFIDTTDLRSTRNVFWAGGTSTSEGPLLKNDQGGSIELGGTQNNSTSYIDFHRSAGQDFNTRIINDLDNRLTIRANTTRFLNSSNGSNGRVEAGTITADSISVNGISIEARLPNYVHKATYFGASNNIVPKPTCNGGTPKVIIIPSYIQYRNDASNNQEGSDTWADDLGGNWRINIKSYFSDALGNPGEINGAGLANTYCYFN